MQETNAAKDNKGKQETSPCTFALTGPTAQTLLAAAVRYAFRRETYMPSLTCATLAQGIDGLEPSTAAIIARDIRNEWCDCYMPDGPTDEERRSTHYKCDVQCFVDLLPLLDERARETYRKYGSPSVPVCGSIRYWSDVPEEIRFQGQEGPGQYLA